MDLPFVRTVIERSQVDSTSDLARVILSDEPPALPLLVLADRQTRGRGRGANEWWSDEGSLTFTLAIDPKEHGLTVRHQPRIALAMAVAIVQRLAPIAKGLGIRWPNDVEIEAPTTRSHALRSASLTSFSRDRNRAVAEDETRFPPLAKEGLGGVDAAEPDAGTASAWPRRLQTGHNVPPSPPPLTPSQVGESERGLTLGFLGARSGKLAGILPEVVDTKHGTRVLIGIGINVHANLANAPEDVRAMAVSLHEMGATLTKPEVLRSILAEIEQVFPRLASDDPTLAERWASLDQLLGRELRVDLGDTILSGLGAGIDAEGALLVATPRETHRLFGGRVLRDR